MLPHAESTVIFLTKIAIEINRGLNEFISVFHPYSSLRRWLSQTVVHVQAGVETSVRTQHTIRQGSWANVNIALIFFNLVIKILKMITRTYEPLFRGFARTLTRCVPSEIGRTHILGHAHTILIRTYWSVTVRSIQFVFFGEETPHQVAAHAVDMRTSQYVHQLWIIQLKKYWKHLAHDFYYVCVLMGASKNLW